MKAGDGMTALLIISTLGVMALGYLVMLRLDRFLSGARETGLPVKKACVTAIVFGGNRELFSLLNTQGIPYRATNRPELPKDAAGSTLLALSKDDLDNLALCSRARRAVPDIAIIALCNDALYMDMYTAAAGDGVLTGHPSAEDILFIMKGMTALCHQKRS